MTFTTSKDGVQRASVRLVLRFTRDELDAIKELAKEAGSGSWRDWLESHAALGIEEGMTCRSVSHAGLCMPD